MYESNDVIQWEKGNVVHTRPDFILGECDYQDPPDFLTLRGIRYRFLHMTIGMVGGKDDGKTWHLVRLANDGETGRAFYVSESHPGEWTQEMIPCDMQEDVKRQVSEYMQRDD